MLVIVFYRIIRVSTFPQVFRTPLSIWADLSNADIRMVSARLPISKFSSPLIKLLPILQSSPSTIGFTVTLMFNRFLSFLARSKYLSFFSSSMICTSCYAGIRKKLGELFIFQNPRVVRVSHSSRETIVCECRNL